MPTIRPVVDEGLGNSAYVIELGDQQALVIDPARDPTHVRRLARWRRGWIAGIEFPCAPTSDRQPRADAADGAQILAPSQPPRLRPHAGAWRTAVDRRRAHPAGRTFSHAPSTSATCCWTAAGRWPCSVAGRCWSARWPAPTSGRPGADQGRWPGPPTNRCTSGSSPYRTTWPYARPTARARSAPPRPGRSARPPSGPSAPARLWPPPTRTPS